MPRKSKDRRGGARPNAGRKTTNHLSERLMLRVTTEEKQTWDNLPQSRKDVIRQELRRNIMSKYVIRGLLSAGTFFWYPHQEDIDAGETDHWTKEEYGFSTLKEAEEQLIKAIEQRKSVNVFNDIIEIEEST